MRRSFSSGFDSSLDIGVLYFLIESLVRYDSLDTDDPNWIWMLEQSPDIKASDLLKLFKSVSEDEYSPTKDNVASCNVVLLQSMPQCKDMLPYCSWLDEKIECLRLFRVMTTDDGFCCVFNALNQIDLMKEANETECVQKHIVLVILSAVL